MHAARTCTPHAEGVKELCGSPRDTALQATVVNATRAIITAEHDNWLSSSLYSVLTLLLKAELGINFAEPSRASLAGRTCGQGQARRVAKTRFAKRC